MIVPASRLLFWVAAIVLPFALMGMVEPVTAPVSLACIGGFALAAFVDALLAPRRLAGVSVHLPPIIRLSKEREGGFELRIKNESKVSRRLRLAPGWPVEIRPEREEMDTVLAAGAEWSALPCPCTPSKRGNYKLESVWLETASPLGFWVTRQRRPVSSEIRVYPNLLRDRHDLAALFLNRGALGLHAQRQMGKGRDFEKLREYVPGDGFDEIHWKASARRGRPITKVFQVERAQEIYVVIDASRLSARQSPLSSGTAESGALESDLERFVTAALVLGLAAEKQGDFFGLVAFTDKIEKFVRAKSGRSHFSSCRDALYTLESKIVAPDFEEVCSFVRQRLRRRALLIFLTALDDPALAESFVRDVELIRRQHVVLVNMRQPQGATPLFSDPDVGSANELYERLGGHLQWQGLREVEIILRRRGIQFTQFKNERLSAELVSQYINIKQRQLL
jgi:uncharacterized protein (DUF58 family)